MYIFSLCVCVCVVCVCSACVFMCRCVTVLVSLSLCLFLCALQLYKKSELCLQKTRNRFRFVFTECRYARLFVDRHTK